MVHGEEHIYNIHWNIRQLLSYTNMTAEILKVLGNRRVALGRNEVFLVNSCGKYSDFLRKTRNEYMSFARLRGFSHSQVLEKKIKHILYFTSAKSLFVNLLANRMRVKETRARTTTLDVIRCFGIVIYESLRMHFSFFLRMDEGVINYTRATNSIP